MTNEEQKKTGSEHVSVTNIGLVHSVVQTELRSCVKVEMAILGSPSLIGLMVSVHVEHQERKDGVTDTGSQT